MSTTFPKFSFIVTFYNFEQYVDGCMESIKNIKIPTDYEILVGDDNSSDKTREKLEYWKSYFGDDKFKMIIGNRNDGCNNGQVRVSNLRKKLLKESTGDYVLYLDGDDCYCNTEFIIDSIELIKKNPNVSVFMFKYQKFDGENVIEADTINLEEGLVDKSLYLRTRYVHAGACVFKKIKNEKFDQIVEKSFFYDDNIIIIYNICFGDLYHVPKTILSYRVLTTSQWHSMKEVQQRVNMCVIFGGAAFLAKEFEYDIFYHYKDRIIYSYLIRKNMEAKIGKEFYNKHKNYALGPLGKTIMDYYNATEEEKEEAEKTMERIKKINPELYKKLELEVESSE